MLSPGSLLSLRTLLSNCLYASVISATRDPSVRGLWPLHFYSQGLNRCSKHSRPSLVSPVRTSGGPAIAGQAGWSPRELCVGFSLISDLWAVGPGAQRRISPWILACFPWWKPQICPCDCVRTSESSHCFHFRHHAAAWAPSPPLASHLSSRHFPTRSAISVIFLRCHIFYWVPELLDKSPKSFVQLLVTERGGPTLASPASWPAMSGPGAPAA